LKHEHFPLQCALVIFALIISASPSQAASPFMMPQPMPSRGMWYEGWFVRVTDPTNHVSFATITTSAAEAGRRISPSESMPGYVALVQSMDPASPRTRSTEYFPERTQAISDDSDPNEPHFQWNADGFGSVSDRGIDLRFPSGEEVSIEFGQRKPWSSTSGTWGPGGVSAYIPFIPLAWWVDSLGTPVTYRLKRADGVILTGTGFAHIEKNWGQIFPRSWMWAQATNHDGSGHLALAGGLVGFGPIEIKAYMIGYKTKTVDVEIRPDQAPFVRYDTQIDSCAGTFKLDARNLRDRIVVEAFAEPASFAPVSVPTKDGYRGNRGKESFQARIKVSVYRDGNWVESQEFSGAALEFGADYMKCSAPPPQS
jgi:tocopherol cyclase